MFTIQNVGFNRNYPNIHKYDSLEPSEYVANFMHILGVEFFTGNSDVDGCVMFIETSSRDTMYIRGDRGYARDIKDIKLIDSNDEQLSYREYTLKYYPEMRHIVDVQCRKYNIGA